MLDLRLVVVSYRTAADVARLIATVPDSVDDLGWEVVIVNNEPADAEALAELVELHHPRVRLIETGANLGYSGGLNLGTAQAPPSRWTVFLNPDLLLGPSALARMARHAGDTRAVVPAIVDGDGVQHLSLRREPSVLGALGDALFGSRWVRRPAALSETVRAAQQYGQPTTVDWATGAALLVPTALTCTVGGWDSDRFFLYSEETDYCRRLRSAGTEIHYLPDAVVVHRGGGSGSSDALHALREVNKVRYFDKWHGSFATTAFRGVIVLDNLLRIHRSRSRAALGALLRSSARTRLPGGSR